MRFQHAATRIGTIVLESNLEKTLKIDLLEDPETPTLEHISLTNR